MPGLDTWSIPACQGAFLQYETPSCGGSSDTSAFGFDSRQLHTCSPILACLLRRRRRWPGSPGWALDQFEKWTVRTGGQMGASEPEPASYVPISPVAPFVCFIPLIPLGQQEEVEDDA